MAYKDPAVLKEWKRQWYIRNRERIRERLRQYPKRKKSRVGEWFAGYKAKLACGCGESHPACLQFHHRDPATKRFAISHAVREGLDYAVILAEIEKCDVLCANCHAKLHFRQVWS